MKIVSGLTGSIFDVSSESGTENLQAWVYALQAQEAYEQFTRESTFKAREFANKALELDPD
ncbi:MAG: hypothetical protein KUG77_29580, partial [Nannocystaceae bacterium]|nr:hypothetical protein [Nannocystaceae bacterium]